MIVLLVFFSSGAEAMKLRRQSSIEKILKFEVLVALVQNGNPADLGSTVSRVNVFQMIKVFLLFFI